MNREIARMAKRIRLGRPIESGPLTLTSSGIHGKQVQFCTVNEADPVQHKHRKGSFYEMTELKALTPLFPKGGTFVDIGAHVGNHCLFAALFMDAKNVIAIEPNPAAYRLLVQNMLVNGVADRLDLEKLGCAVGASAAEGWSLKTNRKKPAATRLKPKGGKIEVLRGDVILEGMTPDMIKIDTPGMELDVLEGLEGLFSRCSPVLLIEVSAANDATFKEWASGAGYTVAATTKRNKNDLNYMLTPAKASKPRKKPAAKKPTTARKTTTAKAKTTTVRKTATKPKTAKPALAKAT